MPPGQGTVTWLVAPRGMTSSRSLETALDQDLTSSLSSAPAPRHALGCSGSTADFPTWSLYPATRPTNQSLRVGLRTTAQHWQAAECDRDPVAGLDWNPGSSLGTSACDLVQVTFQS